jgi:hypothetical protein
MWYHNNNLIDTIDDEYVAFVYMITNLINNKRYIGLKTTKSSKIKKVKGRRKRYKVESDWRTYWSSCEQLKNDVITYGENNFKREIMHFCKSKGTANYLEAKEQFLHKVLEDSGWYNNIVNCRVHRKHLKL